MSADTRSNKQYLDRGQTYTVAQILKSWQCDHEYPSLAFRHQGKLCCIQLSHMLNSQIISVPGFADARFTYIRTTFEEIPLFSYADERPIENFVDIEPSREVPDFQWVTLKGFYRNQ